MTDQDRPVYRGSTAGAADVDADLLCVPVFGAGDGLGDLPWLDAASAGDIVRARTTGEFSGRLFDTFQTRLTGRPRGPSRVVLVGAGDSGAMTPARWRHLAAVCGYRARQCRASAVAFVLRTGGMGGAPLQHVADGFCSAEFDEASYRTDTPSIGRPPAFVTFVDPSGAAPSALQVEIDRGRILGESANFTRALANEPANVLTPAVLAERVASACAAVKLGLEVLDEVRLAELGMRLLLGVGQASVNPPRLIVIRHEPPGAPAAPVLGFVGKGITFDTGGVSIKPADGMERMKSDMSGAAAVAGAMLAIARLGVPTRVVGVIPAAENMVGGRAIRPGDVLRAASGRTVEVINTDAEGRLVLGDALWYAGHLGCTHLLDAATLTGACSVALGRHVAALLGEPEPWVVTVRESAARGGDRVWPLPIYDEAREQLRSDIADIINSAGRAGGVITAAAFLREFVGGRPWAHLDIAGTAWAETKEPYQPKGPTGIGVRTFVELARAGTTMG